MQEEEEEEEWKEKRKTILARRNLRKRVTQKENKEEEDNYCEAGENEMPPLRKRIRFQEEADVPIQRSRRTALAKAVHSLNNM